MKCDGVGRSLQLAGRLSTRPMDPSQMVHSRRHDVQDIENTSETLLKANFTTHVFPIELHIHENVHHHAKEGLVCRNR
jgi:hypothetical protein